MRVDPMPDKKSVRTVKQQELQNLVTFITRIVAVVIAFVSVFVFFFKILYF